MSIIKPHDIVLYGSAGEYAVTLRPLCDAHLPLLYRWNADPEVLYWCEGADVQENDAETVHDIYGRTSQHAFCFLVEANGVPIGECWLQRARVPDLYPDTADVRRIDMMLGEKAYWNCGIGTALIGILVDFAFRVERVDALHEIVYDYNKRSQRVFEKNGFTLIKKEPSIEAPAKAKEDFHYRLTRQEYFERQG